MHKMEGISLIVVPLLGHLVRHTHRTQDTGHRPPQEGRAQEKFRERRQTEKTRGKRERMEDHVELRVVWYVH